MTITRIDKDTVKITSEIEDIVKIPSLKEKLLALKSAEKKASECAAWANTLSSDKQEFVALPISHHLDIAELEARIKEYEELPYG